MGERRINRTQQEYAAIAAKLPSLKMLSFKVNQLLQSIHRESDIVAATVPIQGWRSTMELRRLSAKNLAGDHANCIGSFRYASTSW